MDIYKECCLLYVTGVLYVHIIGGGRFGMGGGAKPQGVWGWESPAGSRGGALVEGLGDGPPEAE